MTARSSISGPVKEQIGTLVVAARRLGPGPMLVRGALFLSGVVAQVVAWPSDVIFGNWALIFLILAVLPVIAPRSRIVAITIMTAVLGWLAATSAYGESLSYWRLVLLAASLYGVHTLAALAAVLPYDAIVSGSVLTQWLLRAGLVVALTLGVAMFTLLVPAHLGGHRYLLASLAGLVLMAGLAGYLAALVRRR
jgi:hypothetical protein